MKEVLRRPTGLKRVRSSDSMVLQGVQDSSDSEDADEEMDDARS